MTHSKPRTLAPLRMCPDCSGVLEFSGSAGIVDYDGRWEAQADRYICENGHTVFVVEADNDQ